MRRRWRIKNELIGRFDDNLNIKSHVNILPFHYIVIIHLQKITNLMKKLLLPILLCLLLFSCGDQNQQTGNSENEDNTKNLVEENEKGDPDFLAFAEEFPVLKELSLSGKIMDQLNFTDYQKIAADDLRQYLYRLNSADEAQAIEDPFGLACKYVEDPESRNTLCFFPKQMIEQDSIQFYYYGQLPISDQTKSLIFFYEDYRVDMMPKGVFFLLFNYDLNGNLISNLDLAAAEKFMSYRIHEAYWANNYLQLYELDYEAMGPPENPYILDVGASYISPKSIQINKDGSLTNLEQVQLPYANKIYKNGAGMEISIGGVENLFGIYIKPMGNSMATLLKWDFAEGNFTILDEEKVYQLNFNGTFDSFEWIDGDHKEPFEFVEEMKN